MRVCARVARVAGTLHPHPPPYRGRWGVGVLGLSGQNGVLSSGRGASKGKSPVSGGSGLDMPLY